MLLAVGHFDRVASTWNPKSTLALRGPRALLSRCADLQPIDRTRPRCNLAVDFDLGERPQLLARWRCACFLRQRGGEWLGQRRFLGRSLPLLLGIHLAETAGD